ncbi:XTP/dITP diphosphatase [Acetohalobium arabaticum]|uniref:dITP/XTP pyrophosphatase n=1 Tax=Acetohalobium arabaticum (strain ATCC 49924 / DSM 5501 / Z-7288) TaxID=574087 RepID=D9QUY3_ACEAZ|nr:XTP/dITP diphosphatase [Acetohalobium arabaticum]ADL12042.1 non-canonical purine NTP pyrophosphatase, rdgB/HAM1 family [Acetohalobium arabaticum DSM 5501]
MRKIFLATGNEGKVKEMKDLLAELEVELVTTFDLSEVPEVVEDGSTLEENAIKKAKELADYTGLLTIADDTGLLVDALAGRPGVYSARYAGEDATYDDNNRKLLSELDGISLEDRTARFKTVMALVKSEGEVKTVEGICKGKIGFKPEGNHGFGYDPLFIPQGYNVTFAEMKSEVKNKISHRAKALDKLKEILQSDWMDQ